VYSSARVIPHRHPSLQQSNVDHVDWLAKHQSYDDFFHSVKEGTPSLVVPDEVTTTHNQGVTASNMPYQASSKTLSPIVSPAPFKKKRRILHCV
jgi:hypothetical protein